MEQNFGNAIVIGAGVGGIATAARLASQGWLVTVIEKNSAPGGRCGQLIQDGHRFDTGPTLFLMPEIFEETYNALGRRMAEHLDLSRIDPTYTINFQDGLKLSLTSDLNDMQRQLEAVEPGSFGGFLSYLAEGNRHYRISLERFVGRNFYNMGEYFSLGNLPLLFKMKALVKHYDNAGKYFKDDRLKAAFTFQNMYLGISPFDAPATYSLLQYTELADGIWFPKGGMYEVVKSLVGISEELGVQFLYDSPVEKIVTRANKVVGVQLGNGDFLTSDLVIANADLPYVYDQLLPPDGNLKRFKDKKFTCSTITFYWATNKVFPQLGPHNVFLDGDYRLSFERIFKNHSLPDEPAFYIHAPARIDPQAAPDGQDTLMALVPVGHLAPDQDTESLTRRAREYVLQRLADYGIPELEESLKFEVIYSAKDWQKLYNLERGAAFGLSHNFTQVGYLRPHNRHAHYSNLYFVGASTHPGTGLPIVLLSARLVAERIKKEWERSRLKTNV
jgi:phytoene desaturase